MHTTAYETTTTDGNRITLNLNHITAVLDAGPGRTRITLRTGTHHDINTDYDTLLNHLLNNGWEY